MGISKKQIATGKALAMTKQIATSLTTLAMTTGSNNRHPEERSDVGISKKKIATGKALAMTKDERQKEKKY